MKQLSIILFVSMAFLGWVTPYKNPYPDHSRFSKQASTLLFNILDRKYYLPPVSMVTKDTTFLGWFAKITYDQNSTDSSECFIFFPGKTELGANYSKLLIYGPHYWLTQGWDGSVVLGNGTHHPVLVSLQPPAENQIIPSIIKPKIDAIIARFKVKKNALYGGGLSDGGFAVTTFVEYQPSAGDHTYGKQFTAILIAGGVKPNSIGANTPVYPQGFVQWVQLGAKYALGMQQTSDLSRDMPTYFNAMNGAVAGSATLFATNFGAATHCCFENNFNPSMTWTAANADIASVTTGSYLPAGENVYQWLLRHGDTSIAAGGNQSPIANAGTNQTTSSTSTTLFGSATDADGTIASQLWTRISGPNTPTITSPTALTTGITGMAIGVHVFRLTVTDNLGATGTSDVQITVTSAGNFPPIANAGPDQTITQPASSVVLAASDSDPDGTVVTRAWTQTTGGSATISNTSISNPTVTGLSPGVYTFRYTVTDNGGATAFDDMVITVVFNSTGIEKIYQIQIYRNRPYSAPDWNCWKKDSAKNFSPRRTTGENDGILISLSGDFDTARDNGPNYANGQTGTPFGIPTQVLKEASYSVGGKQVYTFSGLNPGALYTIANIPSRAGSTADSVVFSNSITSERDTVNATNNYTLSSQFLHLAPTAGGIIADTVVRKSGSAGGYNSVIILTQEGTPTNQAPQAFAGPDQAISFPVDSVYAQGSGTDADGTIVSYRWQISGPTIDVVIGSPNSQNTWFTNLDTGTYIATLTVTDDLGAIGTDQFYIFSSAHTGPTVLAIPRDTILPLRQYNGYGPTQTRDTTQAVCKIAAGPNTDQLTITQVLGPAVTIVNPHALNSNIYGFVPGDFLFKIVAKNLTDSTIKYWHILCKDYQTINEHGFNPTPKTVHLAATGPHQMVKTNLDKTYFAATGQHIMGDDTLVLDRDPGGTYTLVNISGFSGVKGHQVIVRVDSTVDIHGTLRIGNGNDSSVVGWAHIDFRVPSKGILFGVVNKGSYNASNNGYVMNATHHTYLAGFFGDSVGVGGFIKNNQDSTHPALTMWNNFRFYCDSIYYCMIYSSGTEGGYKGNTNPNGNVGIGGNVGASSRLDTLVVMYSYFGNTGYDGLQCIDVRYLENMHNWFPNTGKLNSPSQRYTTSVGGTHHAKVMYNFGYGGKEGFVGTPQGLTEVKYNYNGRAKIGGAGIFAYSYRGEPFGSMPSSSYVEYKNIDSAHFDIEYNIADVPELGAINIYNLFTANSKNQKSIMANNLAVDSLNRAASTLFTNASGTQTNNTVFNQRGLIVDDLSTQLGGPLFRLHYIPDATQADFTDSYAAYQWYWNKLVPPAPTPPCGPNCIPLNGKKPKFVNQ